MDERGVLLPLDLESIRIRAEIDSTSCTARFTANTTETQLRERETSSKLTAFTSMHIINMYHIRHWGICLNRKRDGATVTTSFEFDRH